jgi:hypothetical protein
MKDEIGGKFIPPKGDGEMYAKISPEILKGQAAWDIWEYMEGYEDMY